MAREHAKCAYCSFLLDPIKAQKRRYVIVCPSCGRHNVVLPRFRILIQVSWGKRKFVIDWTAQIVSYLGK